MSVGSSASESDGTGSWGAGSSEAELVRRAAALIRDRAHRIADRPGSRWGSDAAPTVLRVPTAEGGSRGRTVELAGDHAAHIAALDPPVALVLAELLDSAVLHLRPDATTDEGVEMVWDWVVEFARRYLRAG